jgi:hypothetical protein
MSDFEVFDKAQTPFSGEPHLTIQKRGTITLNAASYALLDAPAAVELLFDPDEQLLGLRSQDRRLPHVSFVRKANRSPGGPWVVSAMAFVHHYGIDTSVARQRVAFLDEDVLCVRTDDPGSVVSRDRTTPPDTTRPRPGPGRRDGPPEPDRAP